jgi:hypothetical protein
MCTKSPKNFMRSYKVVNTNSTKCYNINHDIIKRQYLLGGVLFVIQRGQGFF